MSAGDGKKDATDFPSLLESLGEKERNAVLAALEMIERDPASMGIHVIDDAAGALCRRIAAIQPTPHCAKCAEKCVAENSNDGSKKEEKEEQK